MIIKFLIGNNEVSYDGGTLLKFFSKLFVFTGICFIQGWSARTA